MAAEVHAMEAKLKECQEEKMELINAITRQKDHLHDLRENRKRDIAETKQTLHQMQSTYEQLESEVAAAKLKKNTLQHKIACEEDYAGKWRTLKVCCFL